jgi:uncharacterized DUF497 family protein
MVNFELITGFDWNQANSAKIIDKHDVLPSEAEQVFMNQPLIILADESHSRREKRWAALGFTSGGRLLFVSFTLRENNTLIRIISARDMTRKEQQIYERHQ